MSRNMNLGPLFSCQKTEDFCYHIIIIFLDSIRKNPGPIYKKSETRLSLTEFSLQMCEILDLDNN